MRIFGGIDPATGEQLILTGSAATEADAVAMRDGFRNTAVRINVTLRVRWPSGWRVTRSSRAPARATRC